MSLFDRIFRRKVSSKNLDAAPPLGKPERPITCDPVSFNEIVEEGQALEDPLTTARASLRQDPNEGQLALLLDLSQVVRGVAVTKAVSSDWQVLPDVGIARAALPPTYFNLPISPEPSVRKLALLRITIALREILTERLFQDLASSKLEIARLCGETLERMRIGSLSDEHGSAVNFEDQAQVIDNLGSDLSPTNATSDRLPSEPPPQGESTLLEQLKSRIDELEFENAEIRSNESERLGRLRFELSQQQQQIVEEKERLDKRMKDADAQSRRLAERESTVWKNFSELQRREKLLADNNPVRIDPVPQGVTALMEEVKRLRAQIASASSSANLRETKLTDEIRTLRERLRSNSNAAFQSSTATLRETRLAEEVRTLKELVSSDATIALKKQMAMQEQLDLADRSIQKLLKAKTELEKSLLVARPSGSATLKQTKREFHSDSTLIAVSDQLIVDWMLDDASPEQADIEHGYLSLTGEGPWPDQHIREMMEGAGFSLWMLPDADVNHVVVGRHSWDVSALEQQIEAMEGKHLRIYSQEMWFAKLATGRDPFDAGDHELLMAFAKGHPALEYLIDRDTPWPEVSSCELVVGEGVFTEGIDFEGNSPLRNFGYQVGVSSGLSVSQRRALLAKFLEVKDLAFDVDASAEYRSHWGRPRSVQRLYRIASHIRWLIGWQGKSHYREQANEDWRGDLQWLKKTYYKPNLHKFRWPGV
jgi:hypothetical protein